MSQYRWVSLAYVWRVLWSCSQWHLYAYVSNTLAWQIKIFPFEQCSLWPFSNLSLNAISCIGTSLVYKPVHNCQIHTRSQQGYVKQWTLFRPKVGKKVPSRIFFVFSYSALLSWLWRGWTKTVWSTGQYLDAFTLPALCLKWLPCHHTFILTVDNFARSVWSLSLIWCFICLG